MVKKQQLILIKGTREGLTLFIDDTCSFEEALAELRETLTFSQRQKDEPNVPVTVKLGNRYLHKEQLNKLENIIEEGNNFTLQSCDSNYILDRKSTRLNSSHVAISYAVFCLKKKKNIYINIIFKNQH